MLILFYKSIVLFLKKAQWTWAFFMIFHVPRLLFEQCSTVCLVT
jgi:hypothetical protein